MTAATNEKLRRMWGSMKHSHKNIQASMYPTKPLYRNVEAEERTEAQQRIYDELQMNLAVKQFFFEEEEAEAGDFEQGIGSDKSTTKASKSRKFSVEKLKQMMEEAWNLVFERQRDVPFPFVQEEEHIRSKSDVVKSTLRAELLQAVEEKSYPMKRTRAPRGSQAAKEAKQTHDSVEPKQPTELLEQTEPINPGELKDSDNQNMSTGTKAREGEKMRKAKEPKVAKHMSVSKEPKRLQHTSTKKKKASTVSKEAKEQRAPRGSRTSRASRAVRSSRTPRSSRARKDAKESSELKELSSFE